MFEAKALNKLARSVDQFFSTPVGRGAMTVVLYLLVAGALCITANSVDSLVRFGVSSHKGARVYYDGVHGARHLWNRDNRRHRVNYHTVSGFNRFYDALKEEGFDIHVETHKSFNRHVLNKYDVFFVGEQTYHARFMSDQEQAELQDWVADGGGLFGVVEHTNAYYMAETFHAMIDDMPVKARMDSICDLNQPGDVSPTWVDLSYVKDHPVTKGVREYRFLNGCSLETPHGVLFSRPSSWSDRYNPKHSPIQNGNKRRDSGELGGPLAGVAAFNYKKGHVVVVGDHNAMSNSTIYWGDHYRFVMNSMKWLAGKRLNSECGFRRSRPLSPEEVGRPFRLKPATQSGARRPVIGAKRRWFFYKSQIIYFESNGFSFYA